LKSRILCLWLAAAVCWASSDQVAARLARQAKKAADAGQLVNAYLLYAEAVARDPQNPTYRANRDALAPAARLLTKANVETGDISKDIALAEDEHANHEPPIERASEAEWKSDSRLQSIPQVTPNVSKADFALHANAKVLIDQVVTSYGLHAVIDADVPSQEPISFDLTQADFHTAMEALTAATGTFVFAVSPAVLYFAPDTQLKRDELEPTILLTFPLPDALNEKDLIDAANAARQVLQLKAVGYDSTSRVVMIRDRITRARIGKAVLAALLLPRAQVQVEVKFITVDTDKNYHYGSVLQTSFPLIFFGHIGGFTVLQSALNNIVPAMLSGGFLGMYGIALGDAQFLAMYTDSFAQTIFDSTVVVGDRQTVDFHFGDKYPIAESLYTGFSQGPASIYNPAPQITLIDLGLVLKITPTINGDGNISMDVESEFNFLGNQVVNTIPTIGNRVFKGNVNLREGQEAILAGMDSDTRNSTRNGLWGLSQIPWLNQILSENTKDHQTSKTFILVKPTITRLPMASWISPQYLVGPERGQRVLL